MLIKAMGLCIVFGVALFGGGAACRRGLRIKAHGTSLGGWPLTVLLGLAAAVFAGGILNDLHLATSRGLFGLVALGLLLAGLEAVRGRGWRYYVFWERVRRIPASAWAAGGLAVVIVGFVLATQMPPKAYNHGDDFQKYFVYPVRMLETGTLAGSSLNALGSETLGGEAFLHGFGLTVLPLSALNLLDAVFGLFLCLAMAAQFTDGQRDVSAARLLGVASVIVINPQYVNISALYLGAALIMAVIAVSAGPPQETATRTSSVPHPIAIGLLYAALCALKSTFVLFVAVHFVATGVALAAGEATRRRTLAWWAVTAFSTAVFLAPWLLLYAPQFRAADGATPLSGTTLNAADLADRLDLLSQHPLFYGATMASYTVLVVMLAVAGLMAWWATRTSSSCHASQSGRMVLAVAAVGVVSYAVILYVAGPRLDGSQMSLRYFTPFAIGIAPAVFGLTAFHWARSQADPVQKTAARPIVVRVGPPLLASLIPLVVFLPSFVARVRQAVTAGSVLAFSATAQNPDYQAYTQSVLEGPLRAAVAAGQSAIPPGEPMLAWINLPFYLDFARNPITDVDPAGLANAWAIVPPVRYIMWEYEYAARTRDGYLRQQQAPGAHERAIATRTLAFARRLAAAARSSQFLYNDGHVLVMRLSGDLPP